MSLFEADELLNMETEGSMETSLPPIPEGEWPAYIKSVGVRSGTSAKGNEYTMLDVNWAISDPVVAEETGIDEPVCRQSIFLDIGDSGLELGKAKNVQLGRLREAVGQNGPGPWSIPNLEGANAIVRVEQRTHDDRIFSDVKGVAAA